MWETVKHFLMTVLIIVIIGKSKCRLVRLSVILFSKLGSFMT